MGKVKGLSAAELSGAVEQTAAAKQALVADPAVSAWVSANAGTGKTHVLVQRVLRLLLSGAAPDAILCLTYTKAAAAEMMSRLTRLLGHWAALDEAALAEEIAALQGRSPRPEELALARCLFTRVLDAPGGLAIMTIHAFCERVLRRFPVEAGVTPDFTMLAEDEQRRLSRAAADAVLGEAAADPAGDLGRALATAVAHAGEDGFDSLLQTLLSRRDELRDLLRYCGEHDPFGRIGHILRKSLGLAEGDTPDGIVAAQAALCPDDVLARAVTALRSGGGNDQKTAAALAQARGKAGVGRIRALAGALLTKDGAPKADRSLGSQAVRKAHAGLIETLCEARDRFVALETRRLAARACAATLALLRLADATAQRYEDMLTERGALDFDGAVSRAEALLRRSEAADWVLYRLDARLAHILVDEAQDTSPAQWRLIQALTGEFFSGDGAGDGPRTLFAVGDEKQSIYSFQGAEPKAFAETGARLAARAKAAGAPWRAASFVRSFRSASAVLEAVDAVFADAGLLGGCAGGEGIRHEPHRTGEAGLVELWPAIRTEKREPAPAWDPFAEAAGSPAPATLLAGRIARQVRHWLDSGERLASQNRAIRPGDILILVRARKPFADPMVAALKARGIPVAGADRMRLTDQLAARDLMALGEALLLPQDDLTLACVLKSPIFGFGEDDLFAIAQGRPGSLWAALCAKAEDDPLYADAVDRLWRWREAAENQAPFEFYMARLQDDGLREALLSRLGPEAADAIDEFANLALAYEAAETPTLQSFLHWLRMAGPEVKRDMEQERDEARVMTVHGAKGLEANIVFVVDGCSWKPMGASIAQIAVTDWPPDAPKLPIWMVGGARRIPVLNAACEARKAAEHAEHRRLLYVAMTRARDRLYICGFENGNGRAEGCWHDLVNRGLSQRLTEEHDAFGNPVLRLSHPQSKPVRPQLAEAPRLWDGGIPGWVRRAAPREAERAALRPSALDSAPPPDAAQTSGRASRADALERGRLVHLLLERLPPLPRPDWPGAGRRLLSVEAPGLADATRQELVDAVVGILSTPDFAELFGPHSRAEVAIAAEISDGSGAPALLSGQIDRLLVRGGDVLVVDFKTGAGIPRTASGVPQAYRTQLAAYRAALRRMFPDKTVRTALLWTDGPVLMEVHACDSQPESAGPSAPIQLTLL